jgi:phytoene dehydrogenase-like protein
VTGVRRAVVVGSGPNGLAGAVRLAKAGFEVTVHEAAPWPGGGCRSAELTLSGVVHDVCSAVLPFARSSPAFAGLDVGWVDPPAPAAHPLADGDAVVLERSLAATAAGLGEDGEAYRALVEPLVRAWPRSWSRRDLVRFRPQLLRTLMSADSIVSRFRTERARAFFAGHAAHSVLRLDRRPSGGFGLVLCAAAHAAGWPFARGGTQAFTDALVRRLESLGGELRTSSPVDELPRADIVLCDVAPRELVRLSRGRLPARYERALLRFRPAPAAFKLDWALSEPIPWRAEACARAGTIHLGGSFDEIDSSERRVWSGAGHGQPPYVLLAQQSRFDDTRGGQSAWSYCHVPNGWDGDAAPAIERQVECYAPGFRERILARHVTAPRDFEAANRNDLGGDIVGGANTLTQLLARPLARPLPWRTPLRGVYLCSASTPPGGGVHGLCGLVAARLALRDLR